MVRSDDPLRELGVLKGPETKQTRLQKLVICAVDVVLTVTNSNQVRILDVNIDARYHATFCLGTFKGKKRLNGDLIILYFLFVFLLLFFLLFFSLSAAQTHQTTLLLSLLFVIIIVKLLFQVHGRIVLVGNVLMMVLSLCQQSLYNFDGWQHRIWQSYVQILHLRLDLAVVAHLGAHLISACL